MKKTLALTIFLNLFMNVSFSSVVEEDRECEVAKYLEYFGKENETVYYNYHLFNDLAFKEKEQFYASKGLIPQTDDSYNTSKVEILDEKCICFGASTYFIFQKSVIEKPTILFTSGIHTCTAFILEIEDWIGASHQLSCGTGDLTAVIGLLKDKASNWKESKKNAHIIGSYMTPAQLEMKEILDQEGFQLLTYATAPVFNYFHHGEGELTTYIGVWPQDCKYSFKEKNYRLLTTVGFNDKGEVFWERNPVGASGGILFKDNNNVIFREVGFTTCPGIITPAYKVEDVRRKVGDQKFLAKYPSLSTDLKELRVKALQQ
jgi:hypothetical protein